MQLSALKGRLDRYDTTDSQKTGVIQWLPYLTVLVRVREEEWLQVDMKENSDVNKLKLKSSFVFFFKNIMVRKK